MNVEPCLINWHVGKIIKKSVLYNQRVEYRKHIPKTLSVKLTEKYGAGWSSEKLKHCIRSAYTIEMDPPEISEDTQRPSHILSTEDLMAAIPDFDWKGGHSGRQIVEA